MRLVIIGAGGFGREVLAYARDAGRDYVDGARFEGVDFLDDRADALDGFPVEARVLGAIDDGPLGPEDRVIVAVGDPAARFALVQRLRARGATFATVVHPTAYVAPAARIGAGTVLAPFAFVGPSARIGEHCALNTYASAGHDAVIGRYGVLSPYAVINGAVRLHDGVFMGTHATVVVGNEVGAWSKIAAGAVALRDVAAGSLVLGNPGKGRELYAPPEGWDREAGTLASA